VFCPDNPAFRKNNPFRKQTWEEDQNYDDLRKEKEEPVKKLLPRIERQTDNSETESVPKSESTADLSAWKITRETARILLIDKDGTLITEFTPEQKRVTEALMTMSENNISSCTIGLVNGTVRYNLKKQMTILTLQFETHEEICTVSDERGSLVIANMKNTFNSLIKNNITESLGFVI
jgi:cytochrome oxidase Cu insertion factor (SCO1/SenC/PrrC family)